MITERDLQDAIAECQGQRNPNANTCIKLASFYTILDHIGKQEEPVYSFSPPPQVTYTSETEFAKRIEGMDINDVLAVFDELMTTLSVVNPALYKSVMRML